jgi:hypothetical protein
MQQNDPFKAIHTVQHIDVTLEYPVDEVWPVFKDMRRWYAEFIWENISGPSYESERGLAVGQILKVGMAPSKVFAPEAFEGKPEPDRTANPDYFLMKTLVLVPEQEIVSVLWGSAFDWDQYTEFYVWKISAIGAHQTRISIDSYLEVHLATATPESEYIEVWSRGWRRSWSDSIGELKKILGEMN